MKMPDAPTRPASVIASIRGPGLWRPCWTLWHRGMVRFLRQRGRVVGAMGTPVIFWLLMGSGLRNSLQVPGAVETVSYLEFSFPGAKSLLIHSRWVDCS